MPLQTVVSFRRWWYKSGPSSFGLTQEAVSFILFLLVTKVRLILCQQACHSSSPGDESMTVVAAGTIPLRFKLLRYITSRRVGSHISSRGPVLGLTDGQVTQPGQCLTCGAQNALSNISSDIPPASFASRKLPKTSSSRFRAARSKAMMLMVLVYCRLRSRFSAFPWGGTSIGWNGGRSSRRSVSHKSLRSEVERR